MIKNPLKKIQKENLFRWSLSNRSVLVSTLLCLSLILLTGCFQKLPQVSNAQEPYSVILKANYTTGDLLADMLKKREVDTDDSIISASFVNIDQLKESSTLGRVLTEQISSRLAQHGYKIIELKIRQDTVFIKEGEGEFILSRQIQEIGQNHEARYVLVGTYAISEYIIFVSAKIVRTNDSVVVASYDYQLQRDFITKALLEKAQ